MCYETHIVQKTTNEDSLSGFVHQGCLQNFVTKTSVSVSLFGLPVHLSFYAAAVSRTIVDNYLIFTECLFPVPLQNQIMKLTSSRFKFRAT